MKLKTRDFTRATFIIVIEIIMAFTVIGFIMVPPISITLMHIPVIIGSILMGPFYGSVFGLSFGLLSLIRASASGNPVDILFSPLSSGLPVQSLIMVLISRIILGVLPSLLYTFFKKFINNNSASIGIAALLSSVTHSLLVLLCLWGFFGFLPVSQVFQAIVSLNGILEAAAAVVLAVAICVPLKKYMEKE